MSSFDETGGKDRKFLSKRRDTSSWTATVRRRVIARAYNLDVCSGLTKSIKETKLTSGTTSGIVEARLLSSFGRICLGIPVETSYSHDEDGCVLDGSGSIILDANK